MQLSPLHLSMAKLFDGRLFRIPDYQRAYSWKTRQRQDLFNDIVEAHRSGREHFMATVVALARDKKMIAADEFQTVELVDGQQRITTLVILLKAIEKQLSDATEGQQRAKHDLGNLLVKGDEHSLVLLQTNHDSSDVFSHYLRQGEFDGSVIATASDRNLADAAKECEEFVNGWAADGKLIELLGTVRNRLSIIYHELADEAIVYRVFEVLNSRGLDVRWIDKTKSQMMSSIFEFVKDDSCEDGLSEMRVIWRDIYRILGMKQGLGDEALRFAGTLASPIRPNRVLGEEDASVALIEQAGKELKAIVKSAEWLRRVVRLSNELGSDVRKNAVTKIAHARFLAVAIMLKDFEPEIRDQLLDAWENVTFRIFSLGGADSRMKIGEYIRLAHDIHHKQLSSDEILQEIKQLGSDYCIDEILGNEDYWDGCYHGWSEELRYLLFRYDEYLAKTAGEHLNTSQWNKIWTVEPSKSIEHIIPQSEGPEFVHHLGNLIMLPPGLNSSLKDKNPGAKAEAYAKCGLRDAIDVGIRISERVEQEAVAWEENEVNSRAKCIEAFVRTNWAD